ncbi:MAG: SDR family oxidoreductase [Legionella sp.]|nr:MAG: SDR family oxidoreductase [Legionella sp.]
MSRLKTVLITGGSGLLALNWACAVREKWNVILGVRQNFVKLEGVRAERIELDSEERFGSQLDKLSPDLVIHTAGLTSVDQCEQNPKLAYQANAVIARNVAWATAVRNIQLIHISTDHLFAGDDPLYEEDSSTHPLNEYAKTKLLAEKWVLETHPKSLIFRTNFFCWGPPRRQSFSDWIICNLREKKKLTLFDDIFFTPILADRLSLAAHDLLEKEVSGIINLAGDQRLSKYQFALDVCHEFGFSPSLIERGKIERAGLLTIRPRDMSLNNHKVKKILGYELGDVKTFLAELRIQEVMGRRKELLESTVE